MDCKKEKLDLSCLPDNFRDDYEEIVNDLLRLKGKCQTFNDEVVSWLVRDIIRVEAMSAGSEQREKEELRQAGVGHVMLVLMAATARTSAPIVFDHQLEKEQQR